jgi:hypothetical protein
LSEKKRALLTSHCRLLLSIPSTRVQPEIWKSSRREAEATLQDYLFCLSWRECELRDGLLIGTVASTSPLSSSLFTVVRSDVSFVTSMRLGSTLSALLIFTTLAFGCPGPDCLATNRARQAPVYVTSTEPCDECHHEPTSPAQRPVVTISSYQCSTRSVVPYTSGYSTFWVSTPTCPSQPTVTSWMTTNGTCAAPQSGNLVTTTLPAYTVTRPVTYTSYATGSPPATVTLPASTLPPITYTTVLAGSCSPSEVYFPGSMIWGTATQLTTITSTIVQTATEYSISRASYPGPTVVSTLPGSTQVITYTRPGETLVFTPSASVQIVTLTTDGATITQTQAASSITYTSIQAPSYYTITTSIDALTLTTVLPALPGSTIVITQTLPAETQYLTSVTSLPAYTTTITQAASTQVLTSYQAASYYTVTTSVEALTITSVISQQALTITNTQAASTQFVTQTQYSAASTFYETTTISLDAITRTRTETSIGLSVSSLETTVTGEFFLPPSPTSVAWGVVSNKLHHGFQCRTVCFAAADTSYSDLISLRNDRYGHLARICYCHCHGDCPWLSLYADYNNYR